MKTKSVGDGEKFDALKKKKYIELIKQGGRRIASAHAVGISHQTFCNHMKKDRAFKRAVSEAETQVNQLVEDALYQAALNGNVVAIQIWLYNRAPNQWRDMRSLKIDEKLTIKPEEKSRTIVFTEKTK